MHVVQRPSYCIFIFSFCNILTSSLDLRVCGSNSPSRAKRWTAQLRYRLLTDSCALRWVALRASALCEGVRRAPRTTHSGAGALQRETPPQRVSGLDDQTKVHAATKTQSSPKRIKWFKKNNQHISSREVKKAEE